MSDESGFSGKAALATGASQSIATAVTFLLSDRARHITMHELVVDGGATLGM